MKIAIPAIERVLCRLLGHRDRWHDTGQRGVFFGARWQAVCGACGWPVQWSTETPESEITPSELAWRAIAAAPTPEQP